MIEKLLNNSETAESVTPFGGQDFCRMFAFATDWLAKSEQEINALNVFPVPDGDTGTNMLLTMRSCIEAGEQAGDDTVETVVTAMARGALLGARGNSGVILSQIWQGLKQGVSGLCTITGSGLINALQQAAKTAYSGITNPVEGTMLTVIRETAEAVGNLQGVTENLAAIMKDAVTAAGESVANTPNLLPILKESGVVDSGGQGVYTLLEGAQLYLEGKSYKLESDCSKMIGFHSAMNLEDIDLSPEDEECYGYCTQFLIKGDNLSPDAIRDYLKDKGQSLIVVGDDTTVRIHIHVLDPGEIVHYGVSLGTIHKVSIQNMDEQHADMVARKKEEPKLPIAVVAVAAGDGMTELFRKLGAAAIIPGGQTMNPSTSDFVTAVESVPSDNIIILPNNKNVIMAAQQAEFLTGKHIQVVPTVTIPQGVAALIAFDFDTDFDANIDDMKEAVDIVRTLSVTRATRSTTMNGVQIEKGQSIAFLDGKLVAVCDTPEDAVLEAVNGIDAGSVDVVTLYYGDTTTESAAEHLSAQVAEKYPGFEMETVYGGQPHYNYLIALE